MFDPIENAPHAMTEDLERDAHRMQSGDASPLSSLARERQRGAMLFMGALAFVGAVSLYDGYLVVRTGDEIQAFEKNPVGLYLIEMDNGHPDVFLRVKAAGTILALTGLSFLRRRSRRLAGPIAFALLAFQTGLLIFLENPFS
jgi:hypothetical protein